MIHRSIGARWEQWNILRVGRWKSVGLPSALEVKKKAFPNGKSHKRDKARGKVPEVICQKEIGL
jgi:hypothetical protein